MKRSTRAILCILASLPMAGPAFAGALILDAFVDRAAEPIDPPTAELLVAIVTGIATAGYNDAAATIVCVGRTAVTADIGPDWAMRTGGR